jgi:hypothetical protein
MISRRDIQLEIYHAVCDELKPVKELLAAIAAAQPEPQALTNSALGKLLGEIHNRFNDREPHTGAWDTQRILVAEVIQAAMSAAQPGPRGERHHGYPTSEDFLADLRNMWKAYVTTKDPLSPDAEHLRAEMLRITQRAPEPRGERPLNEIEVGVLLRGLGGSSTDALWLTEQLNKLIEAHRAERAPEPRYQGLLELRDKWEGMQKMYATSISLQMSRLDEQAIERDRARAKLCGEFLDDLASLERLAAAEPRGTTGE